MKLAEPLQVLDSKIPGKIIVSLFLILICFAFIFFNTGFKPELQDNAWTQYWAYDYINNGITEDRFIGNGLANLNVTGITPAFLYGSILNLIGWTLARTLLISTFLILAAQGFWILILKDKGWSRYSILVFVIIALLLDAYFEPAHTSKSDAFTFFMLSIAFYSFTKEKYLLAGLFAVVCVESHPIGLTVFFYMLGHFLGNRKAILKDHPIRPFVYFSLGIVLGVAYYFALHFRPLFQSAYSLEHTLDQNGELFYFSSYILKYFIPKGLSKHLPELLIILLGIIVGIIRKYYKKDPSLYWIVSLVFLSSLFNPRPVHTYVLMAFPAFLMVLVDTVRREKFLNLTVLYFFLLLVPQYGYLVYKSRQEPSHKAYVETIRESLPGDKTLPVLGSINEWFACVGEREYHHYSRLDFVPDFRPDEFFLIVENDGRGAGLPGKWSDVYQIISLRDFDNHGEAFEIFKMELK